MSHLRTLFASSSFPGSTLSASTSSTSFTVKEADDFAYTDPIDGSVSTKQGLYIKFTDGSRVIFRLSGTGSSGATVRLYVEKYSKNEEEYGLDAQDGLKPLIEVALGVSKLKEYTGRDKPDVITVSYTCKGCVHVATRIQAQQGRAWGTAVSTVMMHIVVACGPACWALAIDRDDTCQALDMLGMQARRSVRRIVSCMATS